MTTKIKIPRGFKVASAALEKRFGTLTFGKMLSAFRLSDEISQIDLAKKVGVSRAFLCDIEKDRRLVSPALAAKLAKVLGYSIEHFVSVALQDQLRKNGLHLKVNLEAA